MTNLTDLTTAPPRLSLRHRARVPAGPGPHPTIFALHGRGSHEEDLLGLAEHLDGRLLWISPRAPLPLGGGYAWYHLQALGVPDQPSFTEALGTVARFGREAAAAYPVDPQRVYWLGFSQGGMMAYSLTLSQPALVSGMIAHSSYLPLAALEAATTIDTAGARGKPILALHGTHDPIIPLAWAQAARDYVTALGADVTYQEFPITHTISAASLAAVDHWLQDQLTRKAQTP